MTTDRVREEWRSRIVAEYTSAAFTQNFGLWLIQLAAPPELVAASLAVVGDELEHARLSLLTFEAAGGEGGPNVDREGLQLPRARRPLEVDALEYGLRIFCFGETVAVPLFVKLRSVATQRTAREALDRIVVDEVRHRDFGWDVLDWMLASGLTTPKDVEALLPALLGFVRGNYGDANDAVRTGAAVLPEEAAWGLMAAREYAEVLARSLERDVAPRFEARSIALPD